MTAAHDHQAASSTGAPRPGWLLDELRTAGRENLDRDHVARYDAKMDSGAAEEVTLLQELGLTTQSVLVDLGAGTGQLTIEAAAVAGRVVAVDVSPVMLHRLRARIDAAGLANVDVVQAGFLTYQHVGEPADVVYSRYALHHLPDFWKGVALARMRAMLGAGGVLRLSDVVWNFAPGEAAERIEAWCASAGTPVDGAWSRGELEEHVRDEHSTFTWLLEPMIERSGFTIERATYSEDGIDAPVRSPGLLAARLPARTASAIPCGRSVSTPGTDVISRTIAPVTIRHFWRRHVRV